jgi:DNA excision repair protein ERCC-5
MGVKGLWRLLLPIGRRVSIEVLEGKILAIDASIWLTQFLKAMRDPETGSVKPAAHLIGFFRRLAKLRFHGIRPVLVFDGATPIIKLREINQRRQRREQFAPNTAGAVQRLAKRLLIQEIKKAKLQKPASGGAFAPGFNLPEDEKEAANELKTASNGEEGDDDVVIEKVVGGSSEEIARTLQEQEWQGGSGDSTAKAVAKRAPVESSEEIARALQEEEWQHEKLDDDGEHKTNDWDKPIADGESVDSEDEQNKGTIGGIRNQDGLALGNLSSLPSHARKDAIEAAKRQQRMRSRQEFMPVAGQPEEYSQVQVRNFLRSTRLNQSIVKMAKELAEKKNANGEGMASDSTRRIIFEKFDKKTTDNRNRKLIQRQRSEEESDSELEWEDDDYESDTAKTSTTPATRTSKRETVILDSSDDEQEEMGAAQLQPNSTSRKGLMLLDSSDDESKDGIVNAAQTVTAPGTSETAAKSMTDSIFPYGKDSRHVTANDESGSLGDESAGGGGFFTASSPNHVEKVGDELDLTTIAKVSKAGAADTSFADQYDVAFPAKQTLDEHSKGGDVSEEISEDDIDWEDGEAEEPEKPVDEPDQPADQFDTTRIGDFDDGDEPANDFTMKPESTRNHAALQAAEVRLCSSFIVGLN